MNNETLDILNSNEICDAVGCINSATDTIEISIGELEKISLSFCKNCLGKFE